MEYIFDYLSELLLLIFLTILGVFGTATNTPTQLEETQGTSTALVVYVIDGDTIEVVFADSPNPVRVRYIGIDTPEPYSTPVPECGSGEASARNQELVSGKNVTLVPGIDSTDQYGRLLAYVYVDEMFVNKTLVAEGYATVLMFKPNTQYQTEFTNLYKIAQQEKLGIWSNCLKM